MVNQIGYIEIETKDDAPWLALGRAIGFEIASHPDRGTGFRMDADRWARILLAPGKEDRLAAVGWEASSHEEYRRVVERLEALGAKPEERSDLATRRNVMELTRFHDPDGVVGELYWGARTVIRLPFRSPEHVEFSAGEAGMGHVTLSVRDVAVSVDFYCGALGLKITEVADVGKLSVTFLRAGKRHHTLALAQLPSGATGVDHVMIEVSTLDDLGSVRDRLIDQGHTLSRDLGRHPTDGVVSLYARTPATFTLEIGWGSISVDDQTWPSERYKRCGWSWGHRGSAVSLSELGSMT